MVYFHLADALWVGNERSPSNLAETQVEWSGSRRLTNRAELFVKADGGRFTLLSISSCY